MRREFLMKVPTHEAFWETVSLRTPTRREIHEESGISQLAFIRELGSYDRYLIDGTGDPDLTELKTITLFGTDEMALPPIDKDNPEAR